MTSASSGSASNTTEHTGSIISCKKSMCTGISTTGAFVASVSGLLFGESTVGLAGTTATLSDKHAGTGKTVVFNGSFGPVVDGNTVPTYGYVLPTTVSANIADVARAALVVSAVADSRSYDGTSVSASAPTVGGSQFDAIGTAATQAFDTKHAGTGKTLTASGLVMNDGNSGNNYLVSYVPVGTGTITQAALTVSAQTDSRTYDGTTNSAAAPIVGGSQFDAVGTAATQSFDTKHATGGKTLTASGLVMNDGNGGNNYAIAYTPVSTGVITQAALTVTAQTDSRTYDGTTASAAAPSISGSQFDTIATAASQVFDTKHAGSGKTLTASGLVMNDGNGGNNYAIT